MKKSSPSNVGIAGLAEARLPSDQGSTLPKALRPLLGPSWIMEGEDPNLYEELLGRVGAAVQPVDIIDWLLVKDVVALTWQIHRSRRLRQSIMRSARRAAMQRLLSSILPRPGGLIPNQENAAARQIAQDWFSGDKRATKEAERLLAQAGLTMADVTVQSLSANASELDRLDLQDTRHERRRDSILQQIERRRVGWAKAVKRASEDVVDAEFKEIAPNNVRTQGGNGAVAEKQ
jgi:hypothetical protein